MVSRDKPPVDEITNFSSVVSPVAGGRLMGADPVAIIMFLAVIFSTPPALRSTSIS
jgi:hypothetical protein